MVFQLILIIHSYPDIIIAQDFVRFEFSVKSITAFKIEISIKSKLRKCGARRILHIILTSAFECSRPEVLVDPLGSFGVFSASLCFGDQPGLGFWGYFTSCFRANICVLF